MAWGRPDWHSIITMEGWDGTSFLPIKTDNVGQLLALMTGKFGGEFRTIALDDDGNIQAVLSGVSEVEGIVGVVQENSQREIQGENGGGLVTVAVDAQGRIISLMHGDFGGVIKTIAVDTNGVMKANLVAQDVAKLYAYVTSGKAETLAYEGTTNNMLIADGVMISEHGTILGGYCAMKIAGPAAPYDIEVKVDGDSLGKLLVSEWIELGHTKGNGFPFTVLTAPKSVGEWTVVQFAHDIAFDTSFQFLIHNNFDSIDYQCDVHYAVTPEA